MELEEEVKEGIPPGSDALEAKVEELMKTKEELKRAKDNAMQSWLDSKPLIDELERLKAALASAKNRTSKSHMIVTELESELDTTTKSIMSKKEEEFKATKMITELSQALDETREELETVKLATDEERRARSKLKQAVRLNRNKLRTSQLKLRATRVESQAVGASAAEALRCSRISEMESSVTVKMTHEEFLALERRAKEEASLADWRVSVAIEQKEAAEASRDFALSRLQEKRLKIKSRMSMKGENVTGQRKTEAKETAEKQDFTYKAEAQEDRGFAFPKARAKSINAGSSKGKPQHVRRSKSNNYRNKSAERRKTSIFHQIKDFLVRSLTKLFG